MDVDFAILPLSCVWILTGTSKGGAKHHLLNVGLVVDIAFWHLLVWEEVKAAVDHHHKKPLLVDVYSSEKQPSGSMNDLAKSRRFSMPAGVRRGFTELLSRGRYPLLK